MKTHLTSLAVGDGMSGATLTLMGESVLTEAGQYNVLFNGLKGDGTDDTANLVALLASVGANSTLYFPDGDYLFTSEVVISKASVYFRGESQRGTEIKFVPTSNNQACFHWELSQNPGGIENMYFTSTNSTYAKTAIKFTDGSDFHIERIHIGISGSDSWHDDTNSSIGIWSKGREVVSISKVRIFADKPIVHDVNPNDDELDIDQFHIYDTYLVVSNNAPNAQIEILNGVNVRNFTVDGYNAWAKGRYGIYWHNTTNTGGVSHGVHLSNIRLEQGYEGAGDAYVLYLEQDDNNIQQMSIEHVYGDTTRTRGLYIKGARELKMSNVQITCASGSPVPLEIVNNTSGGKIKQLTWDNCIFGEGGGESIIPDNLILTTSIPSYSSTFKLPTSAEYRERHAQNYLDPGVGVDDDLTHIRFARSLIAPQIDAGTDLTMDATAHTITSASALDFTGILRGDEVYLDTAGNVSKKLIAAEDATTSVITVNEAINDEPGVPGTVLHGVGLWHSGRFTYLKKTTISMYMSTLDAGDQVQHTEVVAGQTGGTSVVTEAAQDVTILEVNTNNAAAAPTSDRVSFTYDSTPSRIWNYRTTDPGTAHLIIEQLNF